MELLGKDLEVILKENGNFTPSQTANIGIQMVGIIIIIIIIIIIMH